MHTLPHLQVSDAAVEVCGHFLVDWRRNRGSCTFPHLHVRSFVFSWDASAPELLESCALSDGSSGGTCNVTVKLPLDVRSSNTVTTIMSFVWNHAKNASMVVARHHHLDAYLYLLMRHDKARGCACRRTGVWASTL